MKPEAGTTTESQPKRNSQNSDYKVNNGKTEENTIHNIFTFFGTGRAKLPSLKSYNEDPKNFINPK